MFYCPFFICGTLWFYAGPLFILTANSYIDKWVRESVVTAVLLFITFCGHVMFLLLTLPVFANKNFPYHVRTTQIGVMEVTGSSGLDRFGPTAYHPTDGTAQTVIIPLTRRTEELIGNMYSQYMATAPPLSLENETPKLNLPRRIDSVKSKTSLIPQISTETNTSDDINPSINDKIYTIPTDNKDVSTRVLPDELPVNVVENGVNLPEVLRSRRNILEPIKRDVPIWSLAKGPCVVAMQLKKPIINEEDSQQQTNGRKPSLRLPNAGEMSTIHEGREKNYVRTPTDIFTVPTRG